VTRGIALWQGVAVVVAAATVLAQEPSSAPQTHAVFRSAVDHVAVDVVVTDTHNQPVTDLTPDDFEITEQGKPQTIADFNYVFIPLGNRTVDLATPVPDSDVSSNVPSASDSRALVMVIDDLHIIEADLHFVKDIITNFVKTISPDDQAAIVFVGHSDLSVDLTNDAVRLLRTADRLRDAMGFGEDAIGSTSPGGRVVPQLVSENAQRADLVLKNVSQTLSGSAFSRRAIFFVSGGSIAPTMPGEERQPPIPDDHLFLNDVYRASHQADVPIYTIDARGLVQPDAAIRGSIGGYGGTDASVLRATIAENIRRAQIRLSEHSRQTGGRSFANRNDYDGVSDELMTDNGSYYMLGYYPNPFAADGKFHALSVKVKRPDVRVRARAGYMASSAVDAAADSMNPVAVAIGSGTSVADVSLRAAAAPLGPGVTAGRVATAVTVEMTYPPIANAVRVVDDDVQMMVAAITPDGKVRATSEHAIHFTGTASANNPVTFFINDLVDLPPQHLALRVGVSSRALGRTGTVQLQVDVPKPGDDKLQLGGLVLASVPATGEQALRFDVIQNVVPFQPTTSRTFSDTDSVRALVPVFWSGKDETLTAVVSIPDATGLKPTSMTLTGTPTSPGHFRSVVDVTLPLAGVEAGPHGLQVEVRPPVGESVKKLIAIEVR
jgi:VWFA-related protein